MMECRGDKSPLPGSECPSFNVWGARVHLKKNTPQRACYRDMLYFIYITKCTYIWSHRKEVSRYHGYHIIPTDNDNRESCRWLVGLWERIDVSMPLVSK